MLVLLVLAVAACAQPAVSSEPVFPSDTVDPIQGGVAELLEAVCPGKVAANKEITCGDVCPEFTGFRGDELGWHVESVIHGHFLSPSSDDAALAVEACESHSMNFGGTVLLTRHSKKSKMLWYKPGVQTERCHKVALADKREILVCIGSFGGQGQYWTALYVQDLLKPAGNLMADERDAAFFEVVDNTLTCGANMEDETTPNPLRLEYVERVTFGVQRKEAIVLSVIAHYGERSMTPEDVKQCEAKQNFAENAGPTFNPPTKRYEIDFLFDGRAYHVAPWSPKAAEMPGAAK